MLGRLASLASLAALASVVAVAGCAGTTGDGANEADQGLARTPAPDAGPPAPVSPLRIMAANTTTGNNQSYDPGEGTRIFEGIKPDIALIQEFNIGDDSTATVRSYVDTTFGTSFSYYRETGQIPNGSRTGSSAVIPLYLRAPGPIRKSAIAVSRGRRSKCRGPVRCGRSASTC